MYVLELEADERSRCTSSITDEAECNCNYLVLRSETPRRYIKKWHVVTYWVLRNLVTSKQFSLFPTAGDDGRAALCGFELAARGVLQFGQGVGAKIRQRMTLEPGPEILDRIGLGRVRR